MGNVEFFFFSPLFPTLTILCTPKLVTLELCTRPSHTLCLYLLGDIAGSSFLLSCSKFSTEAVIWIGGLIFNG